MRVTIGAAPEVVLCHRFELKRGTAWAYKTRPFGVPHLEAIARPSVLYVNHRSARLDHPISLANRNRRSTLEVDDLPIAELRAQRVAKPEHRPALLFAFVIVVMNVLRHRQLLLKERVARLRDPPHPG